MSREKWEAVVVDAEGYKLLPAFLDEAEGILWASRRIEKLEKVREAAKEIARDREIPIIHTMIYATYKCPHGARGDDRCYSCSPDGTPLPAGSMAEQERMDKLRQALRDAEEATTTEEGT